MLEKEMGINQFSIYASFGSKQGVFVESLRCYQAKLNLIVNKLKATENGVEGIKQYFYDFIEFSKENEQARGCLLANTATELGAHADSLIIDEIRNFTNGLRNLFHEKLSVDGSKSEEKLSRQANFLMVAMTGLALTSKVYEKQYLEDFIESTFESV